MAKDTKKARSGIRWKLGIAALVFALAAVAVVTYKVRRFILADPQFTLSRVHRDAITIKGWQYTSRPKVQRVFAADYDHSIFAVPLNERRRRLLALDWVDDAWVSRIWPDRLVVTIRERQPVAFVFYQSGVLLIDARGALLDPPPQAHFTFPVLNGIREDETEVERAERVRALLLVQEEMGYLFKTVSEVNVADLDNIRIVAEVDNRAVELILGDTNFARRYQNFLTHYPEIHKRTPGTKTFDLRLDDRITAKE